MKKSKVMWLCEGAIMVAAATVLSMIEIIKMPYGGSVTAVSMLPIIIFAYRYRVGKGLIVGLVYALIQLLLGAGNLSYATSIYAAIAIILLDYVVAFTVLGFAGIFRKDNCNQATYLALATISVCVVRYICHVITGCTVWAGVSIPTSDGLIYSLGYNAAYMVPETVVTTAAVWYVAKVVNLKSEVPTRLSGEKGKAPSVWSALSLLFVIATVVFDAVMVFSAIQTAEGYNITAISNINLKTIIIATVSGAILSVISMIAARHRKNR